MTCTFKKNGEDYTKKYDVRISQKLRAYGSTDEPECAKASLANREETKKLPCFHVLKRIWTKKRHVKKNGTEV